MSYCYCDSYSYPYRAVMRKARKQHRCEECGHHIKPGESYEYAAGLCEGQWFDAKTCALCVDLREYVKAHVPCFCVEHGAGNEPAIETAQEYAHEAPGFLFRAYRKLIAIERRPR